MLNADVAELVDSSASAAGGRKSECEKVKRSKSMISGTANCFVGAADNKAGLKDKYCLLYADVAELADAPDLGSGVSDVQVQVLSSAPKIQSTLLGAMSFLSDG